MSVFDKYVYITWLQRDSINKLGSPFTAKSSDGGLNFTIDQIPISANQILDAANIDTSLIRINCSHHLRVVSLNLNLTPPMVQN